MADNLLPVSMKQLGRYGYYAEADTQFDDPRYAGSMSNIVFDDKGRPTSRKGYVTVLASGIASGAFKRLHYYRRDIGSADQWIAAADDAKIYLINGDAGSATASDITGTITTPTSWNWQFVTYNDKVIGMQQGDGPIVYTGTGAFSDFNAGATNLPTGNCLLSAWGRLFGSTADGQGVNWTGVLGEDFDAAGSGQLNVRKVWGNGADRIIGLAAFGSRLIIFGSQNILIYRDTAATTDAEGLNPNSSGFTLEESLQGQGLVGRDAEVAVGDDLFFLSQDGVRTLRRAIAYEKMPMYTLTRNIDPVVQNDILNDVTDGSDVQMCYHPHESILLLKVGSSRYYLDPRAPIRPEGDEGASGILRATLWEGIAFHTACSGLDGKLRFALSTKLGEYSGYNDNDDQTYQMDIGTVWLTANSENLKFLKRIAMFANTQTTYLVRLRWAWDFADSFTSRSVTVAQVSAPSEWGEAEWGEGEWAGDATSLFTASTTGSGSGTFFKIGFSLGIDGSEFSFNNLFLQMKKGRLTRN